MNKTKSTFLALVAVLLSPMAANADIIEVVEFDLESGAQFVGTITFSDGHEGVLDTAGLLTGGSNNYNFSLSWTWCLGALDTASCPSDYSGEGYYNDWLMDGTNTSDYSVYLGISWLTDAQNGGSWAFVPREDAYYWGLQGNNGENDAIVGYRVSVPEPGTLALLGIGLLGMGLARRKNV